ncbi:hypothetical protein [Clostridium beijerinckii]|uniref:hypothetical protein n=1 Tax=Clostridium beijerinckii TaxID=1520 RepID=UPI0022E258E4|nr:hypothetical protein [Clostridium beijerinckii]
MIEIPSILMLNCLGSYFYSIVRSMSQSESEHSLLYYLSSGALTYEELSLENVRKKYQDNPWGYQPIVIKNTEDTPLLIDDNFFKYLFEKHNIIVETIDMNKNDNLIANLIANTSYGRFTICNVDEYYIPESPKFYKKQHNKHFLLIKSIDLKKLELEIIDSEKNHTFFITFEDMERAVYQSKYKKKLLYKIDCSSYTDKVNKREVLENFKNNINLNDFVLPLIEDMSNKLTLNECDYFYRGYYYTILSKVIPYSQMTYHLLKDNKIDFYDKAEKLTNEWKMLCNFMLFKMHKNNNSFDSIVKKLNKIREANCELCSYIQ